MLHLFRITSLSLFAFWIATASPVVCYNAGLRFNQNPQEEGFVSTIEVSSGDNENDITDENGEPKEHEVVPTTSAYAATEEKEAGPHSKEDGKDADIDSILAKSSTYSNLMSKARKEKSKTPFIAYFIVFLVLSSGIAMVIWYIHAPPKDSTKSDYVMVMGVEEEQQEDGLDSAAALPVLVEEGATITLIILGFLFDYLFWKK